jgi:hypothetical protein
MTTININISDLKETPQVMTVSFTLCDVFTTEGSKIKIGDTVSITTDTNGLATINLSIGDYVVQAGTKRFVIGVSGTGTANLIDLIDVNVSSTALLDKLAFFNTLSDFPTVGVVDKLYVAKNTRIIYLWSGTAYVATGGSTTNLSYTASSTQGQVNSDTGTDATIPATDGTNAGLFLPTEKAKLAGIDMSTKIDVNGNNSAITYANFTPSTAPTYQEGRVWYDSTTKALSVYDNFSGTSIQLGKELIVDVRNNSGTTILNGQVVYVGGATGQNPTIALARADNLSTAQIIGVATHDIANNTNGKITILGIVNDLNTSAFSDGQQVYLSASTAGALTATPPTSPNFVTFVGYILHSHVSQGKLLVACDRAMANDNNLGTSQIVFPSQNAVKTYVDTGLATKANLSGATFTGNVQVPQINTSKQTLTPAGTTQTINWNNGSIIDLVLTSATGNVTLTLQNPVSATSYLIEVTNGATARNLIFPAGTLQAGGGGNTYTGTANTRDIIAVLWDGTQYLISVSKKYS